MNILEKIIAQKRKEVAELSELYPVKLLERSIYFNTPTVSLRKYLTRQDKSGVIAEFKRKSPSKGMINKYVPVEKVSIGYMQAGASALSVLTDKTFFGGSNEDLTEARRFNYCPILRKEFIVDPYQVLEARSIGADAILLIASVLSPREVADLTALAHSLQLEVLFEVHDRQELKMLEAEVDVIGVNNRNLTSFETNVNTSLELADFIPKGKVKVSESGIGDASVALTLRKAGFDGFLIGEQFMKHSCPEDACATFIRQFNQLAHEN